MPGCVVTAALKSAPSLGVSRDSRQVDLHHGSREQVKHPSVDSFPLPIEMEKMSGEIRDCEKAMRGLMRTDTSLLKGVQIYRNFVRPHNGLNGKTPATKAGIKVEDDDNCLALIQNAANNE